MFKEGGLNPKVTPFNLKDITTENNIKNQTKHTQVIWKVTLFLDQLFFTQIEKRGV